MPFEIWMIGKTSEAHIRTGMELYEKRVGRYLRTTSRIIQLPKQASKLDSPSLKAKEADAVLGQLRPEDILVLLDEKGSSFTSREFAGWLEKRMVNSAQRTVFLIGGAYGFHPAVRDRAAHAISLSSMTFSHQLVRLVFWEQFYRAIAIIRGLPYHND